MEITTLTLVGVVLLPTVLKVAAGVFFFVALVIAKAVLDAKERRAAADPNIISWRRWEVKS